MACQEARQATEKGGGIVSRGGLYMDLTIRGITTSKRMLTTYSHPRGECVTETECSCLPPDSCFACESFSTGPPFGSVPKSRPMPTVPKNTAASSARLSAMPAISSSIWFFYALRLFVLLLLRTKGLIHGPSPHRQKRGPEQREPSSPGSLRRICRLRSNCRSHNSQADQGADKPHPHDGQEEEPRYEPLANPGPDSLEPLNERKPSGLAFANRSRGRFVSRLPAPLFFGVFCVCSSLFSS